MVKPAAIKSRQRAHHRANRGREEDRHQPYRERDTPADQGARQDSQVPRADTAAGPSRPRRVLVVDDNRDAADSLAILLRMKGHEVRTAHDGVAAVGEVERFRPDVVLLDLGLPGLNGYEVAERIREYAGLGIDTFILSGYPHLEECVVVGEGVLPMLGSER